MFDEERFKVLLSDYFDESLKGNDRVTFEEMLKTTAKARELFWEAAEHHAIAREWALTSIGIDRAALIEAGPENIVQLKPERRSPLRFVVPGLAAAAALVMGFLYLNRPVVPVAVPEQAVAEIEPVGGIAIIKLSSEARWAVPGEDRLPNDELKAGPLHLMSGSIKIQLYSGTDVWVSGPAEINLISQNEIHLKSGALLAEVPAPAVGFRVISGDLTMTDLGTEFGVSSVDGVNEVHVFNGRVAVRDSKKNQSRMLSTGQAMKVESGTWSGVVADYSRFADRAAIREGLAAEHETRFLEWTNKAAEFSRQPGVLLHYLFTPGGTEGAIPNLVPGAPDITNGTLIGGEWSTGRWERKKALSFNGVGDRVRMVVPGEYESLTFLTWLRLDDMPKGLAAALRAEETVPGALRLGIDDSGRVRMGVYTPDTTFISPLNKTPFQWDIAMSKPIIHREIGHWTHLAAVYDSPNRVIELWLNGEMIARKNLRYGFPAKIGVAQIGSALVLGDPVKEGRAILGRMDEFAIVDRAFAAKEIRAHYRAGKPRDAKNMADPVGW